MALEGCLPRHPGLHWGSGDTGGGVTILGDRTGSVEVLYTAAGRAAALARGGLRGTAGGPALQPFPDDLRASGAGEQRDPGNSASSPPSSSSEPLRASQSWGKRCRYSPPEMEEERWIWETGSAAEGKKQFILAAPHLPSGTPLSMGGLSPTDLPQNNQGMQVAPGHPHLSAPG